MNSQDMYFEMVKFCRTTSRPNVGTPTPVANSVDLDHTAPRGAV